MDKKINLSFWKSLRFLCWRAWDSCVDRKEFSLASNGSDIEEPESVAIEDQLGTDENNKTVYNKTNSMISKESIVATS